MLKVQLGGAAPRSAAEGRRDLEGASEEGERRNLGTRQGRGVGDARLEVGDLGDELDRALAGQGVVLEDAAEGNLREAAVLDLRSPHGGRT